MTRTRSGPRRCWSDHGSVRRSCRDRHVEHVRSPRIGLGLDLDAAPAQPPAPGRDLGAHAGEQRLAAADEPSVDAARRPRSPAAARAPDRRRTPRSPDRRRSRVLRPTTRPAGSRRPVALHVRGRAVEVPVADARPPRGRAAPSGRQYWRRNGRCPNGPVPCHGRGHGTTSLQVSLDAVAAHMLGVTGERGADPHAAAVVDRVVEDRRAPLPRLLGHADERPPRADAAQHDRRAAVGPREAPEPAGERGCRGSSGTSFRRGRRRPAGRSARRRAFASSHARTNPSRSPSSTRSALPTSKSVRWSLTIVYGCRT